MAKWSKPRSPQPWGLTAKMTKKPIGPKAFPTAVGINRWRCGAVFVASARSPQPWGLTAVMKAAEAGELAFPTAVGINRLPIRLQQCFQCVPHSRGD